MFDIWHLAKTNIGSLNPTQFSNPKQCILPGFIFMDSPAWRKPLNLQGLVSALAQQYLTITH